MVAIFDLDGTLALIEHRQHYVRGKRKNWDKFFTECINDLPNRPIIEIAERLQRTGVEIIIFSGRSEVVREQTLEWLKKYFSVPFTLIMRPDKNYTPDDVLKKQWLENASYIKDKSEILCVFDDRQRVVDMWRKEGLTCLQVAPGDF